MTTTLAPAFHVNHRTIAGTVSDPIHTVKNDTWVTATATITTAHTRGTGSNTRVLLGLTADNGAIAVATIDPVRVSQIPDFFRRPGTRVEVSGFVRHLPGIPTTVEAIGVHPAA
ncbi:hypothetical protein [Streptomyces lydicus]|uniref:hypothetical protein n=1 Tax=Streptomyces lydicus TaxID=47763 RepID=UPI0037AC5992